MITIYRCDVCDREFDSPKECRDHERTHFEGNNRIKYDLISANSDVCDYCQKSYYVYGCERDCDHKKLQQSEFLLRF